MDPSLRYTGGMQMAEYGRVAREASRDRTTSQPRSLTDSIEGELRTTGLNLRRINNLHYLESVVGNQLTVTATLCPLYAPGDMSASSLLVPPYGLTQSRVAAKWGNTIEAIGAVQKALQPFDAKPTVVFTLADRGVISGNPEAENPSTLDYHAQIYNEQAEEQLGKAGIDWRLQRYSDMDRSFPTFIQTGKPTEEKVTNGMVHPFVEDLKRHIVFDPTLLNEQTGQLNQKGRALIASLVNNFGYDLAKGFLITYGLFDRQTTQPQALNIYTERNDLLLNVTNLFAHSNNPRVDILC